MIKKIHYTITIVLSLIFSQSLHGAAHYDSYQINIDNETKEDLELEELQKIAAQEFSSKKQNLSLCSNCGQTADRLVKLYTNDAINFKALLLKTDPLMPLDRHGFTDHEYLGSITEFKEQDRDHYRNPIAQKLLKKSSEPENLLFYIIKDSGRDLIPTPRGEGNRDYHAFIIRKKSDGTICHYKILHSWYNLFTLNDWLLNDLTNISAEDEVISRRIFGYNPTHNLSPKQIEDFIGLIGITNLENKEEETKSLNARYYIKMFEVADEPIFMKKIAEKKAYRMDLIKKIVGFATLAIATCASINHFIS